MVENGALCRPLSFGVGEREGNRNGKDIVKWLFRASANFIQRNYGH